MMNLQEIGWSEFFEKAFAEYRDQGFHAGRITIENRDCYSVMTEQGELIAEVAGRLLFARESAAELPKVGDWVALQIFDGDERAIIQEVLPRKTKFSRKVAGKKMDEQVIATNIDVVFLVQSLDDNFNVRRLERALVMIHNSGADPVVLLNKTDICEKVKPKIAEVKEIDDSIEIFAISATENSGISKLKRAIKPGLTFAFIGSSGVGKSTIINRLIGEELQKTQEVRTGDSKGRHTTTKRELIKLKNGACLIDTPGMRELQLWQDDAVVVETFNDIDELTLQCHFSDCTHTKEVKCAVLAALESGDLTRERFDSYKKLQAELASLEQRRNPTSPWELRRKQRSQGKLYKQIQKHKRDQKKGK